MREVKHVCPEILFEDVQLLLKCCHLGLHIRDRCRLALQMKVEIVQVFKGVDKKGDNSHVFLAVEKFLIHSCGGFLVQLSKKNVDVVTDIGGLAVVAFWRSPHGPLGSGPPRAGCSQRRKRKEKGEKGKKRKKERRRKKRKGKRREEREENLRPIWAGYSVFRHCTSLYTRPLILQLGNRPQVGGHRAVGSIIGTTIV